MNTTYVYVTRYAVASFILFSSVSDLKTQKKLKYFVVEYYCTIVYEAKRLQAVS
jgi:hypothetical protein